MAKFAKLFDLENDEQVLVTIDYNNEDVFEVKIRTHIEGCTPVITLSFDEEEKAIAAMNKYEKENAIAFIEEIKIHLHKTNESN